MGLLDTDVKFPLYVPMTAWLEHGPFAMWFVEKMQPRRIVELGTHYGYSYFAMCEAVKKFGMPTECFAVDTWVGEEHAGFYDESVFESVFEENKKYASFSHLLRKTFSEALADVENGSVDILHVDGRHFYDDVKEDFESWIPKLSPSAVVLFHDTEVRERDFGVYKYWAEVSKNRPSINFRHCHGLGVLFWGKDVPQGLSELAEIAGKPQQAELVIDYFACAGSKMVVAQEIEQVKHDADMQIERFRSLQADLEARLSESDRRRELSEAEAHEAKQRVELLPVELADARQRPGKYFWKKYKSKALYALATQTSLFSQRRRDKFKRSAQKRDPKRSLPGFNHISNASTPFETHSKPSAFLGRSHAQIKPDTETVMVVSHDASWTGAPILALNLVRELSKRYNVVSVLLGGGELVDSFSTDSVNILLLDRHVILDSKIANEVADFSKKNEVSKAFVNSVESRSVLPGLKREGVTSVALLHEFASYTRPESAFAEVFSNADQVVFSTRVTLENATSDRGYEAPINIHILAQGKCIVPKKAGPEEDQAKERLWLDRVLRPDGANDREFLVIGAGTIELRKGVDLFIETATRVIKSSGGARFRFVWFGHGYDTVKDRNLSAYLADQINRAGIQSQVQIVRSTSEIEHAYATADLMLMSSRLDPLPNVAIDMLLAAKPVMCFDRTTGIVDFLDDCDLREFCVASYLDTSEMAQKILNLADDPELLACVANKGNARAREIFDFPAYAARLDEIATTSGIKADRVAEDLQYLLGSDAFRTDLDRNTANPISGQERSIRQYLENNRTGPSFRRPVPGFNQLIYAEDHGWGTGEDPFVAFLKSGRPEGRWALQVVDQQSPVNPDTMTNARVALHIHAFHIEEFKDIIERLKVNITQPTLFISAPERYVDLIHDIIKVYPGPIGQVQATPNRGRDIGPLLTAFGPKLVADFDIIGHLHTKRSLHVNDQKIVKKWTHFLMENTIGGTAGGPMLDRIVTTMSEAPELGIIYPDDPHIIGWTRNGQYAADVAARMGFDHLSEKIDFPVGTMFWMRSEVLKRFVDMNLGWIDYPAEPVPSDGSMLHAMERLFGVVPGLIGMKSGVTNVKGITR